MVFSSLLFLFGFLPTFILLYLATPAKFRNATILIASYLFYAWGAPRFVFALLAASFVDYLIGKYIYHFRDDERRKKLLLAVSVTFNLSILFYFKYANFFAHEVNRFLTNIGMTNISWTEVALPVGISFFTFHKLSYIVDVYRNTVAPAPNFGVFALYIVLFPQLIAGPIIRYHDICDQLISRITTPDKIFDGIFRFSVGLAKKVLIADPMGLIADKIFGLNVAALSPTYAWLGILAYTYQIYFDFSGYSDMAIGLGKMMGFEFPENFNCPYISQSITEFWRRWHISLSNWMREYLYIPLGGNRVSMPRMYVNLCVVFLLSGLWHGASWNFIFWGLYHGGFLIIDKIFWLRFSIKLAKPINILLTFLLVIVGWVFFRSPDLGYALRFLTKLFLFSPSITPSTLPTMAELVTNRAAAVLGIATFFSFVPVFTKLSLGGMPTPATNISVANTTANARVSCLTLRFSIVVILLLFSVSALTNSHFHPFIYFRF